MLHVGSTWYGKGAPLVWRLVLGDHWAWCPRVGEATHSSVYATNDWMNTTDIQEYYFITNYCTSVCRMYWTHSLVFYFIWFSLEVYASQLWWTTAAHWLSWIIWTSCCSSSTLLVNVLFSSSSLVPESGLSSSFSPTCCFSSEFLSSLSPKK